MMNENKPLHTISYGAIQAAIWRNDTAKGIFYDVSFSRRYRTGDTWMSTYSFGVRDLPILAKAAQDAHSWIHALPTGQQQTDHVSERPLLRFTEPHI